MSDPNVARWKQQGQTYLWQSKGIYCTYPCWNLTADSAACAALIELLDRMIIAKWSSRVAIDLARPSKEIGSGPRNCKYGLPFHSARRWVIEYSRERVRSDHWSLVHQNGEVRVTLGSQKIDELRSGIVEITQGEGDWGLAGDEDGPDDQVLYFWWLPHTEKPRRKVDVPRTRRR